MATAKVSPLSSHPQSATITAQQPAMYDPKDIVRETLMIVHECNQVLTGSNQLFIELVATLVVVRLQKAGAR